MPTTYAPRFAALPRPAVLLLPVSGFWLAVNARWQVVSTHASPNAAAKALNPRKDKAPVPTTGTRLESAHFGPHALDLKYPPIIYHAARCTMLRLELLDDRILHAADTGTLYGPFEFRHPYESAKAMKETLRKSHKLNQRHLPISPSTRNAALRFELATDPPPTTYGHPNLFGTYDTPGELHDEANRQGLRRITDHPLPAYTRPNMMPDDARRVMFYPGDARITRKY